MNVLIDGVMIIFAGLIREILKFGSFSKWTSTIDRGFSLSKSTYFLVKTCIKPGFPVAVPSTYPRPLTKTAVSKGCLFVLEIFSVCVIDSIRNEVSNCVTLQYSFVWDTHLMAGFPQVVYIY